MNSVESFVVIVFVLMMLYFVTLKMQENMVVLSPSNRNKSVDIKSNNNKDISNQYRINKSNQYVTKTQKLNKLNKLNDRLERVDDWWLNGWLNWN